MHVLPGTKFSPVLEETVAKWRASCLAFSFGDMTPVSLPPPTLPASSCFTAFLAAGGGDGCLPPAAAVLTGVAAESFCCACCFALAVGSLLAELWALKRTSCTMWRGNRPVCPRRVPSNSPVSVLPVISMTSPGKKRSVQ